MEDPLPKMPSLFYFEPLVVHLTVAAHRSIPLLFGKSALELSAILVGALLGALIGQILMVPRLSFLALEVFAVPIGIALVLLIFHTRLRGKYTRQSDSAARFAHWFIGGVGGAFAALLITAGPGLYDVSPTLGFLATIVFVSAMFLVVLILNIATSIR